MKTSVLDFLGQRILSFYPEIKSYIKDGIFPKPRFLILYPTNICPFHCSFCDYQLLNRGEAEYLHKHEWEYILNEFKNNGGQAVELCGGGEPLACPDILSLVKSIVDKGLHLGVLTSGANLHKYELNYFLAKHASYVRISFESGSPEKWSRIKGVNYDGYNKILNPAKILIKNKSEGCQVSYKYTIGRIADIEDIKKAMIVAEESGFDSIQFKLAVNVGLESFSGSRDEVEESIYIMAESYLKNTRLLLNFKKFELPKELGCFTSVVHTLIDYHGDIYICCYYRHRMEQHRIGNIFKSGFQSVWNSYTHWEKQKTIKCEECNLYDCRFIKYNLMMNDALTKGQLEFI